MKLLQALVQCVVGWMCVCVCVCVCVYPVLERAVVDCLERAKIVGCAVGQVVCGGVS